MAPGGQRASEEGPESSNHNNCVGWEQEPKLKEGTESTPDFSFMGFCADTLCKLSPDI